MRFFLGSIKDEEGIEEESESDNGDGKEEDRKTIKEVSFTDSSSNNINFLEKGKRKVGEKMIYIR